MLTTAGTELPTDTMLAQENRGHHQPSRVT